MIKYSSHPERYPVEERYREVRKLVIHIMKRFRINLQVENLDLLTKHEGNYVLLCNHMSMMDPLMVIALSEKPVSFVSKKENKGYFMVGRIMRSLDSCFLDRGNLRQNAEALLKVDANLRKGDVSYIIYPEGTRQKNVREDMHPLHQGSFKVGAKAGVDTITAVSYGTFRCLGKHDYKNFLIQVRFLESVKPHGFIEEDASDLIGRLGAHMQENVNELREKDDAYHLGKHYKEKVKDPWYDRYLNPDFTLKE